MARRGRFGSFLVYLVGLLVVAGAAFTGVRLWQDKDAQLVASREAMAEGLAKGPADAGGDDRAGAEGAADHAAGRYAAVSGGDAVRQGRRLPEVDRGRPRRSREGGTGGGAGGVGGDRSAIRCRGERSREQAARMPSARAIWCRAAGPRCRRRTWRTPRTAWRNRPWQQLAGDEVVRDSARAVRRHGHRALRRCRRDGAELGDQPDQQPAGDHDRRHEPAARRCLCRAEGRAVSSMSATWPT